MTLDRYAIFQRLNVAPRGIFIVAMHIEFSGTLVFECQYDPEKREPFQLIFEGCKHIACRWNSEAATSPDVADVVSMFLGEGNYQEQAIIHTDLFEITLSYQRLIIQKAQVVWSDAFESALQSVAQE